MKNTLFLFVLIMVTTLSLNAQKTFGSLDEVAISEIQNSFQDNSENRALVNAVSHNDIKGLAKNRENDSKQNHFFSNEVKTNGISNQKSSGRCWLYTGLNTLKPMVQQKYELNDFEFSHTYNFFWDQFEKANLFLTLAYSTASLPMTDKKVEWLFKNPIGDGGQWTTFADIVNKYGLVPAAAMPDSYQSEKTATMSRLIKRKLREQGLEMRNMASMKMHTGHIEKAKNKMLQEIYRILVLSLGEPPIEFQWQFKDNNGVLSELKKYTPKQFYTEIIGIDLNEYVMLMDDPRNEYYKLFEVEYDRNLVEGANWKYINLPVDQIKGYAKNSIIANEAMYFSCDVGKQLDITTGTLDINNYSYDDLMGVEFKMDKKQRIETFESGSTHGMALVGVNILENGEIDKWKLENSWGTEKGNKGYLTMTDKWFDEYMFRLVINKRFLSPETLKLLDQKAELLPPWDSMFADEE